MEKTIHSVKRGAFQRELRTTTGQRLVLERRLALICWMQDELQRRRRRIMEDKEQLLEPLLLLRTCPKCFRLALLSHTHVDTPKNQIVCVYECQCGEQFSDG
jgi:hypothetical protein